LVQTLLTYEWDHTWLSPIWGDCTMHDFLFLILQMPLIPYSGTWSYNISKCAPNSNWNVDVFNYVIPQLVQTLLKYEWDHTWDKNRVWVTLIKIPILGWPLRMNCEILFMIWSMLMYDASMASGDQCAHLKCCMSTNKQCRYIASHHSVFYHHKNHISHIFTITSVIGWP
jgi:hypothetical protein